MAAGEGGARTFILPQAQTIPLSQEQGVEPQMNPMMENLRATSEGTQDYYQAFGNLDAFAKNMWKNYQIDVTRADYSNPDSIKAHDTYLKASAYVNQLGNQLKREGVQENAAFQAQLTDPDAYIGEQEGREYDMSVNTNLGRTDRVLAANQMFGGEYNDQTIVDESNAQLDIVRENIREEIANAPNATRKMKLTRELEMLGTARYNENADLDRNQRERAMRLKDPKPVKQTVRPLHIQATQGGDMTYLKALKSRGKPVFQNVEYNAGLGKIFLTYQDGTSQAIDLRQEDGGQMDINEAMNQGQEGTVDFDTMIGLNPKVGSISTGDERAVGDTDPRIYEEANNIVEDFHMGNYDTIKNVINNGKFKIIPGSFDDEGAEIPEDTYVTKIEMGDSGAGQSIGRFFGGDYPEEGIARVTYDQIIDKKGTVGSFTKVYDLLDEEGKQMFTDLVVYNAPSFGFADSGYNYKGNIKKKEEKEITYTPPEEGTGEVVIEGWE